jgi:hypothetical protein
MILGLIFINQYLTIIKGWYGIFVVDPDGTQLLGRMSNRRADSASL